MKKISLRLRDYVALVTILLLGVYCLNINIQLKEIENSTAEIQANTINKLKEGDNPNDLITLYFPDSNVEYLIGEKRNIKEVSPQKAIQALIEGPTSKELIRALPKELEVTSVSIKEGVAYVYIHESVPAYRHGDYGSSTMTRNIINSISATLILNESFGVEKIKLEGDIVEILYGIDIESTEFNIDMNQIKEY